ncbi:MAG: hypothetical protein AAF633_20225 [Chloroflexota bacterium]
MSRTRLTCFLAMLLACLLLIACGSSDSGESESATSEGSAAVEEESASSDESDSQEAEPTATVAPTTTPAPTNTPEPTATAEPQVELGDEIRSDSFGFAVQPPAGLEVETFDASVLMSDDSGDLEAGIILNAIPVDEQTDFETILAEFAEQVVGEEGSVGDAEAIEVNGIAGFQADFTGMEDGEELTGRIMLLEKDGVALIVFGGSDTGRWETEFADIFSAVVNTIDIFPPAEVTVDSGGSEDSAVEQPADEMTSGDGELIVDEANGFSILVPAGLSANQTEGTVFMLDPIGKPGATMLFSVVQVPEGVEASLMQESLESSVLQDSYEIGASEPISINGVEGSLIPFTGEENGEAITGAVAFLSTVTEVSFLTATAPNALWESDLQAMFNSSLNSIQLTGSAAAADSGSSAAPQADQAESEPAAEETSGAAVADGSGGDGIACMSGDEVGIMCITSESEWVSYTEENSTLSSNFITAMAACPNGNILASTFDDINIFDGQSFSQLAGDWGFSSPDAMACDANGGIWVVYFEGASYFDGSVWTNFEYSVLATDDGGLVNDVVVDANGTAWVLTSNSIARYSNNGEWTRFEEGSGLDDTYFFSNLAVDANGTPYASFGDGFLAFDGSAWSATESGSYESFEHLAVDSGGQIYLATFDEGVKRYSGATFSTIDQAAGLLSTSLRSMAKDGSDRIWVGSDYGLSVITSDGISTYLMENSGLDDNRIDHIAVTGPGPVLPERITKEPGSMTGNIVLDDGSPLAAAAVEVCVEPFYGNFYGETPCSDQPLFFQTTTDQAGNFAFENLPSGQYVMVFFVEDGWAQLSNEFGFGSGRVPVYPTEDTYVGEITIESDEE